MGRKRCCCGCISFTDAFDGTRGDDGVNVVGSSKYSLETAGAWAVSSGYLVCITANKKITVDSGAKRPHFSGIVFPNNSASIELSNGVHTQRVWLQVSGSRTLIHSTFNGIDEYTSVLSSSISYPYSFPNPLEIFLCQCSKDWNADACVGIVNTGPDLAFATPFLGMVQGDFFTDTSGYVWTLKASAGVKVGGLDIYRLDQNCGTHSVQCREICGGPSIEGDLPKPWPDTVTIQLSGYVDVKTQCVEDVDAYKAALTAAADDATAATTACSEAHGDRTLDLCNCLKTAWENARTALTTLLQSFWTCKPLSGDCTTFNATYVLDRVNTNATTGAALPPWNDTTCAHYSVTVTTPSYYGATPTFVGGVPVSVEPGQSSILSLDGPLCTKSLATTGLTFTLGADFQFAYYDSSNPHHTKIRMLLSGPMIGSGQVSAYISAADFCAGFSSWSFDQSGWPKKSGTPTAPWVTTFVGRRCKNLGVPVNLNDVAIFGYGPSGVQTDFYCEYDVDTGETDGDGNPILDTETVTEVAANTSILLCTDDNTDDPPGYAIASGAA